MTQPNILLIVCDQMIAELTGVYGHPVVQTPNLDALAARGIRFDTAYTPCPICAPARQCMISGKHTSSNRCYDNAAPLVCDEPTVAHYMTNAGYDTVLGGKMHYVGPDQLHGFRMRMVRNIYPTDFRWTMIREDRGLLFSEQKFPPENWDHVQPYLGKNLHIGRWNSNLSYDEETHFRALEYVHAQGEAHRSMPERVKPFFLCVSYHHPHEVFWPPQELWDLYENAPIDIPEFPENMQETFSQIDRWLNVFHGCSGDNLEQLQDPNSLRRLHRAYYALVTYVDRKVGELMAALEENGLDDNTVVMFTSDHGDMLGQKGMVQKRVFYDWSCRVPMLLAFPDRRAAGTVVTQPVSLLDILPTCLDLAGVPESERLDYDGQSLLPLIDGGEVEPRIVFSEMHGEAVFTPCFMVRSERYKYIYVHGHDEQLFDMPADPGEWNSLLAGPDVGETARRIADEHKAHILARFDLDAIEADVRDSINRRRLIQKALMINNTTWRADPPLDSPKTEENHLKQYLPNPGSGGAQAFSGKPQ